MYSDDSSHRYMITPRLRRRPHNRISYCSGQLGIVHNIVAIATVAATVALSSSTCRMNPSSTCTTTCIVIAFSTMICTPSTTYMNPFIFNKRTTTKAILAFNDVEHEKAQQELFQL